MHLRKVDYKHVSLRIKVIQRKIRHGTMIRLSRALCTHFDGFSFAISIHVSSKKLFLYVSSFLLLNSEEESAMSAITLDTRSDVIMSKNNGSGSILDEVQRLNNVLLLYLYLD